MEFKNAKWIWSSDEATVDEYAEFYAPLDLTSKSLNLLISADSNYAVYLNGELCAHSQYADFPHDKVYDDINLSDKAKVGRNHLAIIVWYYGIDTTSTYHIGNAALMFEAFSDGKSIAFSSENTLSRKSRAYVSGKKKIITLQLGLSYHYDATAEDSWKLGELDGFSDSAIVEQTLPLRPRSCERLVLLDKVEGKLIKEISPTDLLFDLGVNTVGYLYIEAESDGKQHLTIGYGEHIADGCVRQLVGGRDFSVEVTLDGKISYESSFRRLGAKYLEVHSEFPLKIKSIGLIPTVYPLTAKPRPASLTQIENEIYSICERTLRLCMHEHYEDCSWREQSLYCMDSRNQMLFGYYAFGEYKFPRANLELISKDNRPDGLLSICYPMTGDLVIPSFSLHYFIECAEYLQYSGDKEFIKQIYPKLESVLDVFLSRGAREGNLVGTFYGKSYWNFYEWSNGLNGGTASRGRAFEPTDAVLNLILSIALVKMAEMSDAIGVENNYADLARKINAAVREEFFDGERGLFLDRKEPKSYSILTNSLAILAGATEGAEAASIAEKLVNGEGLTSISLSMKCFFYDALLKVDFDTYAPFILSAIEKTYRPMVEYGVGTVWETDVGESDFANAGSLCHGWSALPIYYYHLIKKADS